MYAGGADSYRQFQTIFDSIIRLYHGIDRAKNKATPETYAKQTLPSLPEGAIKVNILTFWRIKIHLKWEIFAFVHHIFFFSLSQREYEPPETWKATVSCFMSIIANLILSDNKVQASKSYNFWVRSTKHRPDQQETAQIGYELFLSIYM